MDNGHIELWDTEKRSRTTTLSHGNTRILCAAFSPDGKTLATTCQDSTVKLWDLERLPETKQLHVLKGHAGAVFSANFDPQGKRLVTGGGAVDFEQGVRPWPPVRTPGEIKIWDVASGRLIGEFAGHESWVFDAIFLPDGKRLATIGAEYKAYIWDIAELLEGPAKTAAASGATKRPWGQ